MAIDENQESIVTILWRRWWGRVLIGALIVATGYLLLTVFFPDFETSKGEIAWNETRVWFLYKLGGKWLVFAIFCAVGMLCAASGVKQLLRRKRV